MISVKKLMSPSNQLWRTKKFMEKCFWFFFYPFFFICHIFLLACTPFAFLSASNLFYILQVPLRSAQRGMSSWNTLSFYCKMDFFFHSKTMQTFALNSTLLLHVHSHITNDLSVSITYVRGEILVFCSSILSLKMF